MSNAEKRVDEQAQLTLANHSFNEGKRGEAATIYSEIIERGTAKRDVLVAASRTLGYQYHQGLGVKQDLRAAETNYRIAVALDDPAATCNLSSLWFDGLPTLVKRLNKDTEGSKSNAADRIRRDPIRGANLLLRLAGRKAYAPALVELGRCYFTGEGVPFDPARSTVLWTRAIALSKKGKGSAGSGEDVKPAIIEAQRALAEAKRIGSDPSKFSKFQESTLEHLATSGECYGPFKSPWGATGYVNFLRSKGIEVQNVSSDLRCDRLMDGTYLRRPPMKELVALSAELLQLARRPPMKSTRLLDEWECKDLLMRFVCGSRPDLYIDQAGDGSTCIHAACETGRLWMVEMLLAKGVDACRRDYLQRTPWTRARKHPEIQKLVPHIESVAIPKKINGIADDSLSSGSAKDEPTINSKEESSHSTGEVARKTKESRGEDWTSVAAAGLRKATSRAKRDPLVDPLFHDSAFYLREKEKENPSDKLHVMGAGKGLHQKDSYEQEVLKQIAHLDEVAREVGSKEEGANSQNGDNSETEGEAPQATSDELLEASLIVAFESGLDGRGEGGKNTVVPTSEDKKLSTHPIYGAAPAAALVALLAHRAPSMYQDLRIRMMTPQSNQNIDIPVTKEEVRDALIKVGAYRSTLAKPCSRSQRLRAEEARNTGNVHFKAKRWAAAVASYSLGAYHLTGGSTRCHPDDLEFLSRLLSNRSAALLQDGNPHLAAADAFDVVLNVAPAWPKSYLRLGKACEGMGGFSDAKTWYECGAKCAGMLKEGKQQRDLLRSAKRCSAAIKTKKNNTKAQGHESTAAAAPAFAANDVMPLGEQNQLIAEALGIEEPMFYVPQCNSGRLYRERTLEGGVISSGPTLESRARYLSTVTIKTLAAVRTGSVGSEVGGGRSLHANRAFQQGQTVISDPPLISISFAMSSHCDHCGCEFKQSGSKKAANDGKKGNLIETIHYHKVPAHDGNAMYCSEECRNRAWSQYYAFMSGPDGDGMSQRYSQLRAELSSMNKDAAYLPRSFHVLAACRIAAITMQCKRRGELLPHEGTFDMPAFASLMRPGDVGRDVLYQSHFRLPFNDQYRAFEQCREVLPRELRYDTNLFGFGWYDNIWGMLMMNCVNGGGSMKTGEVTSVCLMRAGSFVNHSENPNCAILPNRDTNGNIAFVALRDIECGEEVTISYVDPSLDGEEKRKLLATQYFIVSDPQPGMSQSVDSRGIPTMEKINSFAKLAKAQKDFAKERMKSHEPKLPEVQAPEALARQKPVVLDQKVTLDSSNEEIDINGSEAHCGVPVIEASAPSDKPIDLDALEEATLESEAIQLKAEMERLSIENANLKAKLDSNV